MCKEEILKKINEFRNRLLGSQVKDKIVKLCLFGSVIKEDMLRENSDIDLLIVVSDGYRVKEKIINLAFDFQTNYHFPIEPIICSLEDLFPIRDYFIYNCMNYGLEVYSMEKDEIKRENCKSLIRLAQEYIDGATNAKESDFFRLAVDAAYNAAELTMKGLILLLTDDFPSSHSGIIGKFGELYIKSGKFEKVIGRQLNQALELRNQARYKFLAKIGKEEAETTIKLAIFMIEQLASRIE